MALSQLEIMRQRLKEDQDRKNGVATRTTKYQDNTIYPFWDIPENSSTVLRLLPDADTTNPYIWAERLMIELPFPGVKGQIGSRPFTVKVPCMEMYGEQDPIIVETRPWWDIEDYKAKAQTYWKKCSFIFQGFVVENGLKDEESPENPIRRFLIGPQIQQIIKDYVLDSRVKHLPTDYVNGIDFIIKKTSKGKYNDYALSRFDMSSRPLSEEELEAIDKYGLFNLKDFLPKKPTPEEKALIWEMFEASVNELPYDNDRFGSYYKASGNDRSGKSVSTTASTVTPKPVAAPVKSEVVDEEERVSSKPVIETPVATEKETSSEPAGGRSRAEDILAMIRNRDA